MTETEVALYDNRQKVRMKTMEDRAISLNAVCDYLREFVNHDYSTSEDCGFVASMINGIKHFLPVTLKTQWIPVSERLPEINKEVIVTDIEVNDTYASYYLGNGYWQCDNGTYEDRIVAWMSLPPRYEPQERSDEE